MVMRKFCSWFAFPAHCSVMMHMPLQKNTSPIYLYLLIIIVFPLPENHFAVKLSCFMSTLRSRSPYLCQFFPVFCISWHFYPKDLMRKHIRYETLHIVGVLAKYQSNTIVEKAVDAELSPLLFSGCYEFFLLHCKTHGKLVTLVWLSPEISTLNFSA